MADTKILKALAKTKNPQGKAVVRATLGNDKTISVVIKLDEGQEQDSIREEQVTATFAPIAEKAGKLYPEFADGLLEELNANWVARGTRKQTSAEKKAEKDAAKAAKDAAKAAGTPAPATPASTPVGEPKESTPVEAVAA